MQARPIRVVQLGDVANVGVDLAAALQKHAHVEMMRLPQPGAAYPAWLKPLAAPARLWVAVVAAVSLRRRRPDIVHVHWVPNAVVPILAGYRFVLHVHGDDARALAGWRRPLFRWLMRRADHVVLSTPDLERWVDGTWLPNPIAPVPGSQGHLGVLIASRADPSKGREIAIAAARLAKGRFPIRVLDGPDAPDWLDRLPEMTRTQFRTAVAEHAVIWGQFKIGALGLTELEAMGAGCSVVAWVDDGTLAAYGGDVPVISVRSPEAIVAATERLLTDLGERRRLGDRASQFVRRWHDPDTIATRLMGIYQAVLAESG